MLKLFKLKVQTPETEQVMSAVRDIPSSKIVVLLSGGLDSTVLLSTLCKHHECFPLTVTYGQRHIKEVEKAGNVADALDLWDKWRCLDLSNLKSFLYSSLSGVGEIPNGHYTDEIQKVTVVPNRNMILLSIAAGYAQSIGASFVAYAAHMNDRAIYPDCRPMFIESAKQTIMLGTDGAVSLLNPVANISKSDIVCLGDNVDAPMYLTWSCYKGEARPCLTCGTCLERTEAFQLAGIPDPALTDAEWLKAIDYLQQYTPKGGDLLESER